MRVKIRVEGRRERVRARQDLLRRRRRDDHRRGMASMIGPPASRRRGRCRGGSVAPAQSATTGRSDPRWRQPPFMPSSSATTPRGWVGRCRLRTAPRTRSAAGGIRPKKEAVDESGRGAAIADRPSVTPWSTSSSGRGARWASARRGGPGRSRSPRAWTAPRVLREARDAGSALHRLVTLQVAIMAEVASRVSPPAAGSDTRAIMRATLATGRRRDCRRHAAGRDRGL